ncbi:DUF3575 domain-containing protein, partial [Daejeonella sp.]|uniref:DUF3575 domain-containing protein n=1 Tax=Daejeonella sp. TaxID=2805397 RepID=UPI0030BBC1FF
MEKKLFLLLALGIITSTCLAQETTEEARQKTTVEGGKNLVKINLLSLPVRNISLGYEHQIGRRVTAALGFRVMPKGGLPLRSTISDLIDDPETDRQLDKLEIGNVAFTPEVRFYLGKEVMRGFYLAPFVRISSYNVDVPIEFDVNGTTQVMPLSGKLNTFTGGLQIGSQWRLGGKMYLDWWILGPQYGSANGAIDGKKALNAQEQQELREELQDIEVPFAETTTTVNASGARLDIKGPWAGLRAGLFGGEILEEKIPIIGYLQGS